MAKEQSMSLNPEKISGLCGRLMCCLSFEHEGYSGSKKCPKAARSNDNCIQNNISPDDKKMADLEKMDEDGDSDPPVFN
jgi:cell fate regulator YaaT (PSP1 superfamily)